MRMQLYVTLIMRMHQASTITASPSSSFSFFLFFSLTPPKIMISIAIHIVGALLVVLLAPSLTTRLPYRSSTWLVGYAWKVSEVRCRRSIVIELFQVRMIFICSTICLLSRFLILRILWFGVIEKSYWFGVMVWIQLLNDSILAKLCNYARWYIIKFS